MIETLTCRFCEKPFTDDREGRAGRRMRYCSDPCRKAAQKIQIALAGKRWRSKAEIPTRKKAPPKTLIDKFCPECGVRLMTGRHKWCSLGCRETAYRRAHKKERLCKNCTHPISEERLNSPYCSVDCYLAHSKCVMRDRGFTVAPSGVHDIEIEPPPAWMLEPMREGLARLLGLDVEIPLLFGHACGMRGHCDAFDRLQHGLGESPGTVHGHFAHRAEE